MRVEKLHLNPTDARTVLNGLAEETSSVIKNEGQAALMTALDANGDKWAVGDEFYTAHSKVCGIIRFAVPVVSWEEWFENKP